MRSLFVGPVLVLGLCMTAAAAEPSRDGLGSIVFSSNRSGKWRIWTVRPDGSDPKQLIRGDHDGHDVDPVFGPDGRSLAFSSTRGPSVGVFTASIDGSKLKRICDGDQAEWSPQGKSIVLRRRDKLFTREISTGKERQISPDGWPHPSGPAWSPDGKTIAFACRWDADNAIFLVASEGGPPVKVYDKKGVFLPRF